MEVNRSVCGLGLEVWCYRAKAQTGLWISKAFTKVVCK